MSGEDHHRTRDEARVDATLKQRSQPSQPFQREATRSHLSSSPVVRSQVTRCAITAPFREAVDKDARFRFGIDEVIDLALAYGAFLTSGSFPGTIPETYPSDHAAASRQRRPSLRTT
jgi:hypothetical protein